MKWMQAIAIPLMGGGRLKVAKKPGEKWKRRKSNAAQIADLIALHKTIALCATCERRMPRKWGERQGYSVVHGYHTLANCDFQGPECEEYAQCNLYHHMAEGYYQEFTEARSVREGAHEARVALRDKRRIQVAVS